MGLDKLKNYVEARERNKISYKLETHRWERLIDVRAYVIIRRCTKK